MPSQVVVVGSGLAALATAHSLVGRGCAVVLVEEREPAAAGPSTEVESYRPWWPGDEVMTRLASRGTDLLDGLQAASAGAFDMNRRGHLLVAVELDPAHWLRTAAGRYAAAGDGPLREHASPDWYLPGPSDGVRGVPGGLDLLEGRGLLGAMPFLGPQARLGVMVRRAGWVDGVGLRRWLLGTFKAGGGTVTADSLSGADCHSNEGWVVSLASGLRVKANGIVLAGPRARSLARRIGLDLGLTPCTRVTAHLTGSASLLGTSPPLVTVLNAPDTDGTAPTIRADGPDLRIEGLLSTELSVGADGLPVVESIFRRLAVALPVLSTHRGPPGRLVVGMSGVGIGSDRRPVAGVVDRRGCYVVTGLEPDVGLTLGASELVAEYFGGKPLPSVAPAVAPGRLTLPVDF